MECVWKNFVEKSKASAIAVVAHSYGGVVTLDLVFNGLPCSHQVYHVYIKFTIFT